MNSRRGPANEKDEKLGGDNQKPYDADTVRAFFYYAASVVSGALLVAVYTAWAGRLDLYSRVCLWPGRLLYGGV